MAGKRKSGPREPKCSNCLGPFTAKRDWQKFCSPECRREFWNAGGSTQRLSLAIVRLVKKTVREELAILIPEVKKQLRQVPEAKTE